MMKQTLQITVNEKTYAVEVGEISASPFVVTVDGVEYTVRLEGSQPSAPRPAVSAPAAKPAPVAAPVPVSTPTAAASAPATTAAAPATTAASPAGGANAKEVRAPMPGVILDIVVKPGQKVTRGQTLCALEAMKMKSMIRAVADGEIAQVHVTHKQKVAHGELMFSLK